MAPANPELREIVKEMNRSALSDRFRKEKQEFQAEKKEVFPSSILPVIATNRAGKESVFPMKWGFSLRGKLIINARAETASEKPLFREAWKGHRCVIPVSGYYEWEHDKEKRPGQKYMLLPDDAGLIRLAGLYRMENGLPAFVVLTRPAAAPLRWMHDRMPLILTKESAEAWICPQADPETIAGNCFTNITWRKSG